jgi:hypothetical protein
MSVAEAQVQCGRPEGALYCAVNRRQRQPLRLFGAPAEVTTTVNICLLQPCRSLSWRTP